MLDLGKMRESTLRSITLILKNISGYYIVLFDESLNKNSVEANGVPFEILGWLPSDY